MTKKDFLRLVDFSWRSAVIKKSSCPDDVVPFYQGQIDLCNDFFAAMDYPRRDSSDEMMVSSRRPSKPVSFNFTTDKWYTFPIVHERPLLRL